MKYYMELNDSEGLVYTLIDLKEQSMILENTILCEMERDIGGEMWCEIEMLFVERGECGINNCTDYAPCNGKSGRCRHLKNGFKETDKKFILSKEGRLNKIEKF